MNKLKIILFIHGLHENAHCWAQWELYFQKLGYNCYTIDYPYHKGTAEELRNKPNKSLSTIRLKDVTQHYANYIDRLKINRPILIGHSMGGLIVQKLIQEKKGSLGICITSAPPKGIFSFKWSFIKSNLGIVNPLRGNSLYCGTKRWFHYAICNTLTREESDEIYHRAVIPESRNIPRSSRFNDGEIDFNSPHSPLLFIGAEKDNIVPKKLNIKNSKAYKHKESIIEYKEFKGKSHSICVQNGWEQVAEYIENWISITYGLE